MAIRAPGTPRSASASERVAARRLTSSKAGATWAPDSRRIAFAATRGGDDEAQIYVIDLAGGEARRVTSVPIGAANPQWRPDGGAILFESGIYPGAMDAAADKQPAADRKARKFKVRVYEHFPIRYGNEWLDDRRPALFVQDLAVGSVARADGFGGRLHPRSGAMPASPSPKTPRHRYWSRAMAARSTRPKSSASIRGRGHTAT